LEDAIVNGGAIRLVPVMLTAMATILGMLPLAMSININFETLLAHGDAEWFVGGDNAAFWGPLAGTIIYGLSFATIVTLLIVPVLYYIKQRARKRIYGWFGWNTKEHVHHTTMDGQD
jgi:multidrug efflux pump subunit AcrB